jgi:hypothetical protein
MVKKASKEKLGIEKKTNFLQKKSSKRGEIVEDSDWYFDRRELELMS